MCQKKQRGNSRVETVTCLGSERELVGVFHVWSIKIVFQNPTDKFVDLKAGEKVAQLIIEKIAILDVKEVESLDNTERGSNGFGSTGF